MSLSVLSLTIPQYSIIKPDIHTYMLPIAGQTAGSNGLKFVVDTHGWPGGVKG